ncbi:MAG: Permuted papain-like amidase enzyme, YaeF/YiiX, C92 family [uncultured Thiotrichaceae bacterium]|uniref:Permuted papain-like amidase enzyme, YaeF/YiiX, C92 family n=1 Tax=uncultured Thiotrichaceae bacterium TaxID=298394 RepID=A0A6S6SA15_9GAMM|nr:MAG: Permuted papain-like amidase enzyme, YaeF/YiiX, C92 family [uncultured Thiotrichaceae bacterium]
MFTLINETRNWLWQSGINWLNAIPPNEQDDGMCHFEFLEREVRPGDVILFAGKTRVSKAIQMIALSPWTHAAIYIGRINDIKDPVAREKLQAHYNGDPNDQLLAESLLGYGTIVNPLKNYTDENLRICRPSGLDWCDADQVVNTAIDHLGMEYDVQQLLDLARFLFPYGILPRRWRSSLFQHNAGQPTHIICSSMIARCFQQVNYPILPTVCSDKPDKVKLRERHYRLFIPSDFDYSPYFEVIKYPAWNFSEQPAYRNLPWQHTDATGQPVQEEPVMPLSPPDAKPKLQPIQPELVNLPVSNSGQLPT